MEKGRITVGYLRASYYSSSFKRCGRNIFIGKNVQIWNRRNTSIGNNSGIQSGCIITAVTKHCNRRYAPEIIIGDNVSIGYYNHISSNNRILIEDDVLIGSYVTIVDNSHGATKLSISNIMVPNSRSLKSKGPVFIGEGTLIGDKVTILPNVKIGKYSIIGANSLQLAHPQRLLVIYVRYE